MKDKAILYIEDNFHNRRIVRKILNVNGYSMVEADDGIVGLEMIKELKPPLVLLDIALPGMDGMEIAQRVKADDQLRGIPLVALTASAMRGDRERFLAAGCDGYLSKPFKAYELVEVVENYYSSENGKSKGSHNGNNHGLTTALKTVNPVEDVPSEIEAVNVEEESEATSPDPLVEEQVVDESEITEVTNAEETQLGLPVDERLEDINAGVVAEKAEGEDADLDLPAEAPVDELRYGFFDVEVSAEIAVDSEAVPVEDELLGDEIEEEPVVVEPESEMSEESVEALDAETESDEESTAGEAEPLENSEPNVDEKTDARDDFDDESSDGADKKFTSQLFERLELADLVPPSPDVEGKDIDIDVPVVSFQNTGPKTILIVEDNMWDARLLRRLFESQNYTVEVAQTGEAALNYLETNQPTVILLDLILPDMTGEDVLTIIRVNEATASIPVVVVSVKELNPKARQAMIEQATSVWSKELLDYRALFAHIENLILAG